MAKKKKVVVSSKPRTKIPVSSEKSVKLVFGKENYKWLLLGIALVALGLILMLGGFNENPNIWDESKIYGFRRTMLAPAVILSGLLVNIYALFR
jgi:hypothetical protein